MDNIPIQGPVFLIEVEKIQPNPQQPRRSFDETALQELAASIREVGIIQPVIVTKIEEVSEQGTNVRYQLIAGERRWKAAQLIGLERIPAVIKNVSLAKDRLELAVIENVQRADLNPVEAARAYSHLQDEFGLTQREIASRIGKSRESVTNTMRLLGLPTVMQEAITKNQISESQGRLLLAVDNPQQQQALFDDSLKSNMSVRELRARIQALRIAQTAEAVSEPQPTFVDTETLSLQKELETALGAPVRVDKSGETGKLIITFYSPEELRGLVEKLTGPKQNDNQQTEPPLTV